MLRFLPKSETFEISWRRTLVASGVNSDRVPHVSPSLANVGLFVACTLMLLTGAVDAQSRRAEHKGPRGIAVIEFAHAPATGDPPAGTARLVPVTIYYNGNYYDASLYEATPAPIAVQTGTVYEVQRGGVALGLFTTTMPREAEDWWYAVGNWQPTPPESAGNKEPAKKPEFENPASNDERPILKRGSSSQQQSPSQPTTSSTAPTASPSSSSSPSTSSSGSGDEGRPVLKRPANETSPSQSGGAQSTGSQSTGQQQVPSTNAPAYGAEEQDPNRPVLRRGKPEAETVAPTASNSHPSPKPGERVGQPASVEGQPTASASAQPQGRAAAYVGVSDTESSDERPYQYSWTKEQQTKLTAKMSKLALEEARKYEQQRKLPAGASWEQTSLRAYDLFTDNDGELIFSGMQNISAPRARKVYVTYAALYDAAGELEPLFSDVTDSEQLDVKGRLELIDAVDSTGDGRGDLLFRRIGISSQKFELYRLTSNGLYKLFDGAVAPF